MSAASEIHLLRDKIAMHMPTDDVRIKDKELAEKIVGRPFKEDDYLETLRFAFDLEARLRYMKADAMLAARKEGGAS